MIAYNRTVASHLKGEVLSLCSYMGGDSDTRSGTKGLYRKFYV